MCIRDARKALDFYKKAFGAIVLMQMDDPTSGKIGHAEIKIGDSMIMLSDESLEMGFKSPQTLVGTPVSICLYVEDVDAVVRKAVKAGAKITRELKDQFYGDRSGTVEDPFGHVWYISTHIKDVTPEEMEEHMKAMTDKC
ncbi:MAG: VOC family protein [Planctomycetota bacterium]